MAVKNSSITHQIALYFVIMGVIIIAVSVWFSYSNSKEAVINRTFHQLTSVREVKRIQLEQFFIDRKRDIELISSFADTKKFLYALNNNEDSDLSFNKYFIDYYKNSHYYNWFIISNKDGISTYYNTDDKDFLVNINKDSTNSFDFKNLWDTISMNREIVIQDFVIDKKNNFPVIYIAGPIFEEKEVVGMLTLGIPLKVINTIMLEENSSKGLGESGESYLVGDDFYMRSTSRFHANSVLKTTVKTDAVIDALENDKGTQEVLDYRGIPVLSSYSKLSISGLNWVILAEIDVDETMSAIAEMLDHIIILCILILVIVFVFAETISRKVSKPIIDLKESTESITSGDYNIELEVKSDDEIGALTESFNEMSKQLKQKSDDLIEREKSLQIERSRRLSAVYDGQEMERQRLSRELHDGLGQSLIAIKLKLESTVDADFDYTKQTVKEVRKFFDNIINEIRRISYDLMPSMLNEFGLVNALQNLCSETEEHSNIKIDYYHKDISELLPEKIRTYLYRISQEAIHNIIKHSYATKVDLRLYIEDNYVYLQIVDNGIGIDSSAIKDSGNGLYNMKERVSLLNGKIEIISEKDQGTNILIRIPHKVS